MQTYARVCVCVHAQVPGDRALLTMRPRASSLTPRCLSFLTGKMGILRTHFTGCGEDPTRSLIHA